MKLKESFICLNGLRYHAFHGVLPQERLTGNDYVVNLKIGYDVSRAIRSDHVDDTLNYADIYLVVSTSMLEPCNLLERVAGNIGQRLLTQFPDMQSVEVEVVKENPPMGTDAGNASVKLLLINDKT
ncbi:MULTISPECIES: dihydroneopterin aldolase [unclassified Prevotella]|uniref:dihydroneopterin aldolase n=1 Tax=unclassified Prevotella TaxID=2638335 RepID=UPI000512D3D5|nr:MULTISPECIES: dihydroneopterin aldolase [unclassified Prevotella]KGI60062.1 dienelactone hydrolase [Prevotella sp. S7 MS 2]